MSRPWFLILRFAVSTTPSTTRPTTTWCPTPLAPPTAWLLLSTFSWRSWGGLTLCFASSWTLIAWPMWGKYGENGGFIGFEVFPHHWLIESWLESAEFLVVLLKPNRLLDQHSGTGYQAGRCWNWEGPDDHHPLLHRNSEDRGWCVSQGLPLLLVFAILSHLHCQILTKLLCQRWFHLLFHHHFHNCHAPPLRTSEWKPLRSWCSPRL